MQEIFDSNYKNVSIHFYDHSIQKINPSGKVVINGLLVYNVDSISNHYYEEGNINLKKGWHKIEISTIDGKYKLFDSIEIEEYPNTYSLQIQFNYKPPIEQYKEALIDHLYQRSVEGKPYTEEQKAEVLLLASENINKEFEVETAYKPTEPHFTFTLTDFSAIGID